MRDVAAITLSRTLGHFRRLLEHLPEGLRGVLVNNAGHPLLTSAAQRAGWAALEPGRNTSFSEGNNLGATALGKWLDPSWLLLLNDDLRPERDMLEEMVRHRRKADMLGALLLHSDGTVNHAGMHVWDDGTTDHLGRHDSREKWEKDAAPSVPGVTFAAVLVRASLWRQLGGLDIRYRYGWEDTDFCLRALQAGATVRCARAAVAVHDECGTRPRGGVQDAANYQTFIGTWGGRIAPLLRNYQKRHKDAEGVN